MLIKLIMLSFTIRYKKIQQTEKKLSIFTRQLRNAEPPDEETARGIIDKLFFLINVTT
jgi:DNA-directed RNA polymerase subunit beta